MRSTDADPSAGACLWRSLARETPARPAHANLSRRIRSVNKPCLMTPTGA
jgi:hypothetical protein